MNFLMKLELNVWSAALRFANWADQHSVLERFELARLTVTSSILNIYVISYM